MTILERLDSALAGTGYNLQEAEEAEFEIVDMASQGDRMSALKDCRGPCVGWEDYIAGRDYEPPKDYKSNRPFGPKDTGKRGIISSQKEADQLEFDGENPFSRKYHGIRPWAPGEVLMTLMYRNERGGQQGLLHTIATKGIVARAAKATHGKYDENDIDNSIQQGALAVLQALPHDEARLGTRFTSFVGDVIQQGMKAGVPPGYQDEYRKARGLRNLITPIVRSALRDARNGEPLETHQVDLRRVFAGVDPKPSPQNPYGLLPPTLLKVRDLLIRAITTGNPTEIQQGLEEADRIFDEIVEKEETYYSPGVTSQGAVGTKPREHGTLIAYQKAAQLLGKQRELAKRASEILRSGGPTANLLAASEALWQKFVKIVRKKDWVPPANNPNKPEPRYHSPYENAQQDLPNSPGFIGLVAIRDRLDRALQSGNRDELEDFITMSNNEQQVLRNREEVKVKGIGSTTMTTRSKETGKESERSNFASQERNIDSLNSEDNKEILYKALMRVSPYQDDSFERKKSAAEATTLLDAINDAVDEYLAARSENLDTTKPRRDLVNIARDLGPSLGEWQEELTQLLDEIIGTIKLGSGFSSVRQDIRDLQKIAKQDVKAQASPDAVSIQQYRMLLRMFGISNYPERGTSDDPEINEQGGKSRWAEAGYPAVSASEFGKETDMHIWTDIFDTVDENGKHVQSVSSARISKLKSDAENKFTTIAKRILEQLNESLGADSIECKMVAEFYLLLCKILVEDVLPGATKMIYG